MLSTGIKKWMITYGLTGMFFYNPSISSDVLIGKTNEGKSNKQKTEVLKLLNFGLKEEVSSMIKVTSLFENYIFISISYFERKFGTTKSFALL